MSELSEAIASVTALTATYGLTRDEMAELLAGPADGGPNGDGFYPVTLADGSSRKAVPSPAKVATIAAAASAGLKSYASAAARDADTKQPIGTLSRVANGSTVYRYDTGGWVADTGYYQGLASVVQPFVDSAAKSSADAQAASTQVTTALGGFDTKAPSTTRRTPVVTDGGAIPLWLERGLLGFKGLTQATIGRLVTQIGGLFHSPLVGGARVPLWPDESGRYAGSLERGKLEVAKGLGPRTLALAAPFFAPRNLPAAATVPIHTDGRTLRRWRAKAGTLKQSGSGKLRVMMLGDSWAEKTLIPQAFATMLYSAYGQAGAGYICRRADDTAPANDTGALDGATLAQSGWSVFDAGTTAGVVAPPAFALGIDGQALYTTGAGASASWTFTGTEFRLHYAKGNGSFRYRVDGGPWTTVTPDGTNAFAVLKLAGLAASAHTVSLDTSVNTGGTVAVLGAYFTTTAGNGVEVLKCGNSALEAAQLATYVGSAGFSAALADFAADVIVVILGTNDQLYGYSSPGIYRQALTALVTAARAASPGVGIVFVAPPQSNAAPRSPAWPLSAFRDVMASVAMTLGCEFYNGHDDWDDWLTENTRGQWYDDFHLNSAGAYRLAARLIRIFFGL